MARVPGLHLLSAVVGHLARTVVRQVPNVMVSPYDVVGDSVRADKPRLWSPTSIRGLGLPYPYDIHPDGKRLAVVGSRDEDTAAHDTVVFVFNFFDYLRKIAPGTK